MRTLALFVFLILASPILAQWGAGCGPSWGPTLPAFRPTASPVIRISPRPTPPADGSWSDWHWDAERQGWYRYRYAPAETKQTKCPQGCSKQCDCGCAKGEPCRCARDGGEVTYNGGIDTSKLSGARRYLHNGREVSREKALRLIESNPEAPDLPDESKLLRMVLIGSEPDRKRVLDDLQQPRLAKLKDRMLVQAYDAGDPIARRRGYVTTGSPSITLQAPDGKVIARNRDGTYPGAEAFAAGVIEAAKPYVPDLDPDLNPKPAPKPKDPEPAPAPAQPFDLAKLPGWAWGLAGVALALFLTRKGEGK